ncbi:hypothetical protein [Rufibacter latericius]|uniref:Uncharacterized protein n=1 Tax=Rufibacter latericius TaxID=2487040 RepID=A0A3M9MBW8_9BACT|nr:hypothetical protein [Rufibacter latericius]RNI22647.1 hypothetical protein EFB08_21370 [Rufibacter latericius]
MKDKYEQLMMRQEAAQVDQTPKDWRAELMSISEYMQEMLKLEGIPFVMAGSGIRLFDATRGDDAFWCLVTALEDTVGWVGAYDARKAYDAIVE